MDIPLLTLIVGPSEEMREVGSTKEKIADNNLVLVKFWTDLLEKAKERSKLHANISSPQARHYIYASSGLNGLGFSYVIRKNATNVEL